MDFGCGTGLLTLNIQPHVRSVTGVDNSPGMIDVLERKIGDSGLDNVRVLCVDIEKGERLAGSYDLVTSAMTLHHIRDIGPLFRTVLRDRQAGGPSVVSPIWHSEGASSTRTQPGCSMMGLRGMAARSVREGGIHGCPGHHRRGKK